MNLNLTRKTQNERTSLLKHRIIAICLAMLLLLPVCYVTSLTGLGYTASLSAKETVCPGYSYILRVALDDAAIGFEGYLSYDTSVLTLDKVVPVNPDLQNEFHVYSETGLISITHDEPVRKMLNITFWVKGDAEIGSQTVVRLTSCKGIDSKGKHSIPDVSFTFTVVDGRSSDTTLEGLYVALYASEEDYQNDTNGVNAILQPAFSSSKRVYESDVPNRYSYYRIKPDATHDNAEVRGVLEGSLTHGETKRIVLTVIAENGTEGTYTIDLISEEAPVVSDEPSQETSDTSSKESDESEESEEESIDNSEPSEEPSEDAESDLSDTTSAESEETLTSAASSSSTGSYTTTSFGRFESKSDNLSGIILCIAAVGGLALIVLVVRIMVLFRKKQK